MSIAGKMVRMDKSLSGDISVNEIPIIEFDNRAVNGVIHQIKGIINPMGNLNDVINNDISLSLFRNFIETNFTYVIDPDRNVKIGYDTLNNPIYQEPIIYVKQYNYLADAALNDESELSTLFIPTDDLLRKLVNDMVVAKGG